MHTIIECIKEVTLLFNLEVCLNTFSMLILLYMFYPYCVPLQPMSYPISCHLLLAVKHQQALNADSELSQPCAPKMYRKLGHNHDADIFDTDTSLD